MGNETEGRNSNQSAANDTNGINAKDFMIGTLIGGIVGASAALLLAPKSGKQLRTDINEQAHVVKDKTGQLKQTAREKSQQFSEYMTKQSETIKEKMKNVADEVQDEWEDIKEEVEDAVEEVKEELTDDHKDTVAATEEESTEEIKDETKA